MIKKLYIVVLLMCFLMCMVNIKADLEIVKTQQYMQTLTLKQLLGCSYTQNNLHATDE
jgi:hypothetical protein